MKLRTILGAAGALMASALVLAAAGWAEPEVWPGVDHRAPAPAGNPDTAVKIELGRRLFYDADLSIDGTMSCSTCHSQRRGFADTNKTHPGVSGDPGKRNVMALANVGFFSSFTWVDIDLRSLEDQAAVPVTGTHPVEMGMAGQEAELARRLSTDACYRSEFAEAFPETKGEISMRTVSLALASFQRGMTSFDAPYDRYRRGQADAISAEAARGEALFRGEAKCASCHGGPLFSDATGTDPLSAFHNIGAGDGKDLGLMEKTGRAVDMEKFRTPSLRNAALTAPYLHDGSAPDLKAAIRAHERSGELRDPKLAARTLTYAEADDLIAFIGTLSDETFLTRDDLAYPRMRCGVKLR